MFNNASMDIFFILCIIFSAGASSVSTSDIRTFPIYQYCGQTIKLKWESIFTAKFELHFPIIVTPNNNESQSVTHGYHGNIIGNECVVNVESWDFQNRLLVMFEEFQLGTSGSECSSASLEVLDGPDSGSPDLLGLGQVCERHREMVTSQAFVTSDKHLRIRLHGDDLGNTKLAIRLVIVAFQYGPCRSYEYECRSGRCIMDTLVCNGHNPCGDNSDCPSPAPPLEVSTADDQDDVLLAAIIAISATLVVVIGVAVVVFRCFRIHRKHQRLCRQQQYTSPPTARTARADHPEPVYERTVSQVEAEVRLSPPSYSTVTDPVTQTPVTVQETPIEEITDTCLEPDENNPPSYACVLLHQEDFHVSRSSTPEVSDGSEET